MREDERVRTAYSTLTYIHVESAPLRAAPRRARVRRSAHARYVSEIFLTFLFPGQSVGVCVDVPEKAGKCSCLMFRVEEANVAT
jgi:hypothetical protein